MQTRLRVLQNIHAIIDEESFTRLKKGFDAIISRKKCLKKLISLESALLYKTPKNKVLGRYVH